MTKQRWFVQMKKMFVAVVLIASTLLLHFPIVTTTADSFITVVHTCDSCSADSNNTEQEIFPCHTSCCAPMHTPNTCNILIFLTKTQINFIEHFNTVSQLTYPIFKPPKT